MITERYSRSADLIFTWYLDRLFRRHFASMHLLTAVPDIKGDLPLILVPNHSTWWDGFLVHFLNRKLLNRRLHLMMLASQLSRFPFFRLVGAFGFQPENPQDVQRVLGYTAARLHPKNVVCMFPQGELLPWGQRPLIVKRGLDYILKKYAKPVQILPLGIRAEFMEEQRPRVYFAFADLLQGNTSPIELSVALESLLHKMRKKINCGDTGSIIFTGKKSLSD